MIIFACSKDDHDISTPAQLFDIPPHFPAIPFPDDNAFTQERWELGKMLFFDPIMSIDSTVSCASCHKPHLSFADDQVISPGVDMRLGTRNASALFNLSYHPYFTRDGEVPTLEMQALVPIQEHEELDFNIVEIANKLKDDLTYVQKSKMAYDREPDAFVITRALSNFQRSLISSNSLYDQSLIGSYEMSEDELDGMRLFNSDRLGCINCHGGFNFTEYEITNNGLYLDYNDPGRYRVTLDEKDRATFKVPSLRNVELTAPYMHDGSLLTLDQVIDHYENGVQNHPNKSDKLRSFSLTDKEKNQLISFLKTLTDESFLNHPLLK